MKVGVLCAPPGWGKTVLATNLIASRECSTLVLVHRKPLVEQWSERLCAFLGLTPKSIGRLGAGRRRLTRRIDIAMIQTLARSDDLRDLVRPYGQVVVDECHHVPAVQVERVLSAIPARYVTGLTATPYRRWSPADHHDAMRAHPPHHQPTLSSRRGGFGAAGDPQGYRVRPERSPDPGVDSGDLRRARK
ncbi:MAG: DEAD/DEAH box helicase family protein [Solirubrobacterales bacterium]|nr:DEAD/DEAH box helicase family protein [Solirubrobacterales bacterium]